MIYKFDKISLTYKKITGRMVLVMFGFVILFTLAIVLVALNHVNDVRFISEETKQIILKEADKQNEFSREKLKAYILELNIKYPEVVLAQAELESGNFTSPIFKENNNMFGMRVATKRPTTNKGEENGFAYYDNWRECVVDYAFYSAQYLSDIKTKDELFDYLAQTYAGDSTYTTRIKELIKENSH